MCGTAECADGAAEAGEIPREAGAPVPTETPPERSGPRMRVEFQQRGGGALRAGAMGACLVTFNETFDSPGGRELDLAIDAYPDDDVSRPAVRSWFQGPTTRFEANHGYLVTGVQVPRTLLWDEVRFVARIYPHQTAAERTSEAAAAVEGWEAQTDLLPISAEEAPRRPALLRADPAPIDSIYQLLATRDAAGARVSSWEEAWSYVLSGLEADLDRLFDHPGYGRHDEVGEDGVTRPEGLQDWQKRIIKYCTGLYYSANYYVHATLDAGIGYPIGVECNTLTDMCAWIRGVPFSEREGEVPWDSLEGNRNLIDLSLTRLEKLKLRAEAEGLSPVYYRTFETDADRSAEALRELRPGSILFFAGHIDTVLRVRRSGSSVRFQLFDTGGTGPSGTPPPQLGRWGGAMKEEPWRNRWPSYSGGNKCLAHCFVPLRAQARAFPRKLLAMPRGPSGHRLALKDPPPPRPNPDEAASVRTPLAQLCISDRSEVLFCSRPFRLSVPIIQLLWSVTNMPQSDRFEARWFIDAGRYGNHQTPANGDLRLEIYNRPNGEARHWRPAYLETDALRRQGFNSKRAEYEVPTPDPFAFDDAAAPAPRNEQERALAALFERRGTSSEGI